MEEKGAIAKESQVNVSFILTNFEGKKIANIIDTFTKVFFLKYYIRKKIFKKNHKVDFVKNKVLPDLLTKNSKILVIFILNP